MPKSAPTRCTDPECRDLATYQGRCERHRRRAWANTSKRNQVLDPSTWQATARAHLTTEPTCRACGSDERLQVDHITELADGGEPYDESNLQTLCEDCHKSKTAIARDLRRARAAAEAEAGPGSW